jgi:hypothetical protein
LFAFDAPDRETCIVRRARTNTPLQALVLLNDPTHVEAARKLAERVMTEAATAECRVVLAFRLATARRPSADEAQVLLDAFIAQLRAFREHPRKAHALLAVGESSYNANLDAAELAAWTIVAGMVFNLDEMITKG